MRTPKPSHARWADLDSTADPAWFVEFLDVSRGQTIAEIQRDPAAYFAFLDPKPGLAVLEVGAGTGSTLHALAKLVAPAGKIVGIDYSQTMVDEATRRAKESGLAMEFLRMDAANLEFGDASFDRASSHIVFQHLPDSVKALSEMIRVTRPGGLVTIVEQDWETLVVDAEDSKLTRTIVNAFSDHVHEGWIGRKLFGMFKSAGLNNLRVEPTAVAMAGIPWAHISWLIDQISDPALEMGRISADERQSWRADQKSRADAGKLFLSFTQFRVSGIKG